jgi:aspartyl-tRNA(Asn)/glutamyl-tRNA(Gln) amidotransferase subunit A
MTEEMTISELRRKFIDGAYTPVDALSACKDAIAKQDGDVHAFLELFDDAEASAEAAAARYAAEGENAPPLLGMPLAIKQNILIKGKRTTAASRMLERYVAPYDATVISRLRDAGAVFIGGTNMDEFAMGSSTEHSAFGPTHNPLDLSRVPGGSSGGSAAAVAMGAAIAAIGTDTGGSVRQPAAFCGVVGFKPTYGALSRHGLIAMGSSLDQAAPLARTVANAELLHSVMAGRDPMDATTWDENIYPSAPCKERYTIGVPRDFLAAGLEEDVLKVFDASLERLAAAGHTVTDISLPLMQKGLAAYYIVMPAEVSSNLARYDGVRYGLHVEGKNLLDEYLKTRSQGFGAEVKRRILLGTYVLSAGYYDAYYGKAERVRDMMRDELAEAFRSVDVIATPTAPTPAFKIGEKSDPLSMYLTDIFTVPANLTGVPALSIPSGTVERDGVSLPLGVQYMGPHAGDARLFDIGKKANGEA